jgi:serine/threonine protein kinase
LIKKLGEGDAGEVYLVEAPAEQRRGILKKPAHSAFPGDVARQAAQIEAEGGILRALHPLLEANPGLKVSVPALLDQSQPGSEGREQLFIVVEQAPGFDLSVLARLSTLGSLTSSEIPGSNHSPASPFLESIAVNKQIPETLLTSIVISLMDTLEFIHTQAIESSEGEKAGLLWNDVKPEHLFWDPVNSHLTVIDWGNARFLEADGATSDRQHSILDDYRQFGDALGRYLSANAPELKSRLHWPDPFRIEDASAEQITALRERAVKLHQKQVKALKSLKKQEEDLTKPGPLLENHLQSLIENHDQLLRSGAAPDYAAALRFVNTYANQLIRAEDFENLRDAADWAGRLPEANGETWQLIRRITQIASRSEGNPRRHFGEALQAAIAAQWTDTLWHLLTALQDLPEPDWWYDLTSNLRRQQLTLDSQAITPLVAIKRVLLTLTDLARQIEDRTTLRRNPDQAAETPGAPSTRLENLRRLIDKLKTELIPNWKRKDPAPPHASLYYSDIDAFLEDLKAVLPESQPPIVQALAQPRAQVNQVLTAWNQKEFAQASLALRQLLLWDPDRRRLLAADEAILSAPTWLRRVHLGPRRGESTQAYISELEFSGRELRNRVGPADWLDLILDGLKRLRRGIWPADLLAEAPLLIKEMPWMARFQRQDLTSTAAGIPVKAEPDTAPKPVLNGLSNGRLGEAGEMLLHEPLDTWVPEARGSSARVYLGSLHGENAKTLQAAIKLMRPDQTGYALPLFREEVLVLNRLQDVPGVTQMLECGFILFDEGNEMPHEITPAPAHHLTGEVLRISLRRAQLFIDQLESRVADGWIPYIAQERRKKEENLLYYCDAGTTNGRFLPLSELLRMTVQICDIIEAAHQRNVVYRDHKILHYYWNDDANGIFVIDWNVARLHEDGLPEIEKQMDLVQFGARALHHILTGRTAPGALPMGPTRPEEIEAAAHSYSTQWTYDDRRLSDELKSIIERVLAGSYTSAAALRDDLKQAYLHLPADNNRAG